MDREIKTQKAYFQQLFYKSPDAIALKDNNNNNGEKENGENGEEEEEDELLENLDFDMPDLGPITLIRQNHQQITLSDLAGSLQNVLEKKESPKKKENKVKNVKDIMWEVDDYHINIEEHIEEFHEKIALLAGQGQKINFIQVLPENDKKEICKNLLLALFLWSRGKINLEQEEHFGEIYIELLESPEGNNGS